jgi:short-subunit dehydrogenase
MKNGFRGKHVVVTGGSAGLGLAIAGAFLDVGAHVSLLARDEQRLREARLALGERAQWTAAITADVTNQEQVERAFADARKFHGPIHVLVNAAGISDRGAIVGTATTRFQELWEINFLGPVRCVNAAADDLVETRGHIVNIGSLASKVASGYLGAYPSSKFALAAYTQQLRIELVPRGVHALLVCPGPIQRADAGRRYDDRAAQLPESARRPAGGAQLKAIDPRWLAARIVEACMHGRAELVVPGKVRWLVAVAQFFPAWADQLIRRKTGM